MAFVDYGKIRAGVDIESVLAHYGIATRKVSNTQMKSDCPLFSHKTAAHEKGTFSISLEKGKFFCHSDSCRNASGLHKGGDAIDLVRLLEGCTILYAAKKLVEWYPHLNGNGDCQPQKQPLSTTEKAIVNIPPSKPLINPPLAFQLGNVIPTHEAIQSRGISVETAKDFGVGFFGGKGTMHNRVIFPLIENGQLIGYAGRTVDQITKDNPKWLLPKNLKKTFLFGLEHADPSETLIIVEACWEVLKACQQGLQAAALLGTAMTAEQEQCLAPFKTIWLMLDDDDAGRAATEKIYARLKVNRTVLKGKLRE